jgi:hypothetical protein
MIKQLAISAALLFPAVHVLAATWINVGGGVGATVEVDAGSIQQGAGFARLWERYTYSPPHQQPIGMVSSLVMHMAFNCSAKTQSMLSAVSYDASGQNLLSSNPPNDPFTDVAPDSFGEVTWKIACFYKKPE